MLQAWTGAGSRVATFAELEDSIQMETAMNQTAVRYEKTDRIAFVTIDNAEHENCISQAVDDAMWTIWRDFREDDSVDVAIVRGEGDKSFCSGWDLRRYAPEIARASGSELQRRAAWGPGLGGITRGIDVFKPIIAAINGYCLAGGMELALACDIRITADHATFGVVNRRWGVGCESGLSQRLPHVVGLGHAMELILSGRWFDAQEAYRMGFVSEVVAKDKLMDRAVEMANTIIGYPQGSLRADKESILRGLGRSLHDGLWIENTMFNTAVRESELIEGTAAFVEKREYKR